MLFVPPGHSLVGRNCRIRRLHICRRVRTHNGYPGYDTKTSDSEAPVLELWEFNILFHCHYFQIHYDSEMEFLLGHHYVSNSNLKSFSSPIIIFLFANE